MPAAFEPMSAEERRRFPNRYLLHLERRHGEADPGAKALRHREALLEELSHKPLRWQGPPLDQAALEQAGETGGAEVRNPTLWWARSAARLQQVVGQEPITAVNLPELEAFVSLERGYHSRLMLEALAVLGLPPLAESAGRPHWLQSSSAHAPRWMRDAVAHSVSTAKIVALTLLREASLRVFAAQPEVAERLELLLQEIALDESGQVHWLRSQLSDSQLAVSRRVFSLVSSHLMEGMPELVALVGQVRVREELHRARLSEVRSEVPRRSGVFRSVA